MNENDPKRKRMTDPTAVDFLLVGKDIQNKAGRPIGSAGTEDRHFREFFGAGPFVVAILWNMMAYQDFIPPLGEIKHLLWTLHFLKAYPRQATVCSTVGGSSGAIDPKTFRKYMWPFIHAVADLQPAVVSTTCSVFLSFKSNSPYSFKIVFESRKDSGSLNDCLISVDGIDVRIPQQGPAIKGNPFSSFKFAGKCGLRYEIGLDILAGNIVWVNGPFAAGKYPDIEIFRNGLAHWLDEFERVEADDGYIGEAPQKVNCPGCPSNPIEKEPMQKRVQGRHESLNGRFKNWEILKSMYRHDLLEHEKVFMAIAVITQIGIDAGEALFEVDYIA